MYLLLLLYYYTNRERNYADEYWSSSSRTQLHEIEHGSKTVLLIAKKTYSEMAWWTQDDAATQGDVRKPILTFFFIWACDCPVKLLKILSVMICILSTRFGVSLSEYGNRISDANFLLVFRRFIFPRHASL